MGKLAAIVLPLLMLGSAAAFNGASLLLPAGRIAQPSSSLALRPRLCLAQRRSCAGFLWRRRSAGSELSMQASTEARPKEFNIYNTLARDKVPFKPMAADGKTVKMYTCGPTIYDFAHIGNFRAFLTYDLLKRWLTYCGYDVDHVCNLTDVDDKIIQRMKRDNVSLKELTDKYAELFFEDLNR